MKPEEITVVLLSRNHEKFADECMKSILRELGAHTKILLVDTGSIDDTVKKIVDLCKQLRLNLENVFCTNNLPTLENLYIGINKVTSPYSLLLSCDDSLGLNFAKALDKISTIKDFSQNIYNFNLQICNESLQPIKTRRPKWSRFTFINKLKLSVGNPGTTAGAIVPTKIVQEVLAGNRPPTLIEDYWLWWTLVEKVKFVNVKFGRVNYRKHSTNLSKQKGNELYAFSLGYCASLPRIMTNYNIFITLLSLFLIPKWIRHLRPRVWPQFFRGLFFTVV